MVGGVLFFKGNDMHAKITCLTCVVKMLCFLQKSQLTSIYNKWKAYKKYISK